MYYLLNYKLLLIFKLFSFLKPLITLTDSADAVERHHVGVPEVIEIDAVVVHRERVNGEERHVDEADERVEDRQQKQVECGRAKALPTREHPLKAKLIVHLIVRMCDWKLDRWRFEM